MDRSPFESFPDYYDGGPPSRPNEEGTTPSNAATDQEGASEEDIQAAIFRANQPYQNPRTNTIRRSGEVPTGRNRNRSAALSFALSIPATLGGQPDYTLRQVTNSQPRDSSKQDLPEEGSATQHTRRVPRLAFPSRTSFSPTPNRPIVVGGYDTPYTETLRQINQERRQEQQQYNPKLPPQEQPGLARPLPSPRPLPEPPRSRSYHSPSGTSRYLNRPERLSTSRQPRPPTREPDFPFASARNPADRPEEPVFRRATFPTNYQGRSSGFLGRQITQPPSIPGFPINTVRNDFTRERAPEFDQPPRESVLGPRRPRSSWTPRVYNRPRPVLPGDPEPVRGEHRSRFARPPTSNRRRFAFESRFAPIAEETETSDSESESQESDEDEDGDPLILGRHHDKHPDPDNHPPGGGPGGATSGTSNFTSSEDTGKDSGLAKKGPNPQRRSRGGGQPSTKRAQIVDLEQFLSRAKSLGLSMTTQVPRPGPANLSPNAGLDEWLEEAKQCHYLPERAMKELCEMVKEVLMEESNIQPVCTPVTICGDIHGQFYDLLELFRVAGGMPGESNVQAPKTSTSIITSADIEPPTEITNPKLKKRLKAKGPNDTMTDDGDDDAADASALGSSPRADSAVEVSGSQSVDTRFIFLGDFVDRGYFSLETFTLLMCLKAKYPDRIVLVRGNHESRQITQVYGFYEECQQKYGNASVWKACCHVFDFLVLAAIVDGELLCVHGGLSPEIRTIDQIRVVARAQEIPHEGAFCDLVWSDPEDVDTWAISPRGAGWLFGDKVATEFNHVNGLKLIARAHQLVNEGYKYHFPQNSVVTVWSAPNYCYRCGNVASIMTVDKDMNTQFSIFSAVPDEQRHVPANRRGPGDYFL